MMDDIVADNYPVVDEMGKENGRVEIKITCKDFDMDAYGAATDLRGGDNATSISRVMERDILKKIGEKLAEIPFVDIDMFFDFFLADSEQQQANKVSKKHFKE